MEIRVLRYFLAVAREGGVTSAAGALHVTQPTLSRQIKDLEAELGQALFTRGGRGLALTAEGALFRERAGEIVALVDKATAEFGSLAGEVAGDVYIGGGETAAIRLVAQAAMELRRAHPGLRYHLYSGNAQDVTERLDKGLLDFGVLINPANLARYDSLPLPAKDTWGVVMRRDSPLAALKAVHRQDLLGQPLICPRQEMAAGLLRQGLIGWFGEDFPKLDIVATFNLMYNAAIMVEAGLGYALSIDKVTNTAEYGALCFRPLAPRLDSGLAVVWKRNRAFSAAAALFLERLRESLAG